MNRRGIAMRIKLTKKVIKRFLEKTPDKDRKVHWDALLPGFGLRCYLKGARTYIVGGRFGTPDYRLREVGDARVVDLEDAREKARVMLALDAAGKDPAVVEAERVAAEAAKKREEERRNGHTFTLVADAFLDEKVVGPNKERPLQRKWKEVTRQVAILKQRWGSRPIHDIKRDELVILIKEKRSTPAEARNLLGIAKQLFSWARDQAYGLEVNVAADVSPSAIIGEKQSRDRFLTTEEIRRLWNVVLTLPHPFNAVYQMLILSGLRRDECACGRWEEIDFDAKVWTVPASRMKGKNGSTKPFKVPLTNRMVEILKAMPRIAGGFMFTTNGEVAIHLGSVIKDKLDRLLGADFEPWQTHDLRRTIATGLTGLGIKEQVADAILAHRKKGIEQVYNRHEYVEERRAALELWGNHVAPPNVTPFRQKQNARA